MCFFLRAIRSSPFVLFRTVYLATVVAGFGIPPLPHMTEVLIGVALLQFKFVSSPCPHLGLLNGPGLTYLSALFYTPARPSFLCHFLKLHVSADFTVISALPPLLFV